MSITPQEVVTVADLDSAAERTQAARTLDDGRGAGTSYDAYWAAVAEEELQARFEAQHPDASEQLDAAARQAETDYEAARQYRAEMEAAEAAELDAEIGI